MDTDHVLVFLLPGRSPSCVSGHFVCLFWPLSLSEVNSDDLTTLSKLLECFIPSFQVWSHRIISFSASCHVTHPSEVSEEISDLSR